MKRKITDKRREQDRLRKICQRERNRSWLNTYKRENSCELCEESDFVCLDFHHLDAGDKDNQKVSYLVQNSTIDRIMEEIDRCMLVCSNCHRRIHYGSVEPGV